MRLMLQDLLSTQASISSILKMMTGKCWYSVQANSTLLELNYFEILCLLSTMFQDEVNAETTNGLFDRVLTKASSPNPA